MNIQKKEVKIKGKTTLVDALCIDERVVITTGRLIKTARIKDEWYEDVDDPDKIISTLKNSKIKTDIFTFWQRLPNKEPKYDYFMERDYIAAVPIKSYDYWYKEQINTNARRAISKARKAGVEVKDAEFNDEFIKGMTNIFNETPIRQGKRFWHYGKDFETIKQEFSQYLFRENIIGAYFKEELIGFIFLSHAGKYAITGQIISKIDHRDKAPNNALIAKAVEVCEKKGIQYLVYSHWGDGSLAEFKRRNGFEKIGLPRYYIPLTIKGKIALALDLHRGITSIFPEPLVIHLKELRREINQLMLRIKGTMINRISSKG